VVLAGDVDGLLEAHPVCAELELLAEQHAQHIAFLAHIEVDKTHTQVRLRVEVMPQQFYIIRFKKISYILRVTIRW